MAKLTHNKVKNGIEIRFDTKPSEEVLDFIKSKGFKYSKYQNMWYNKYSESEMNELEQYFETEISSVEKTGEHPKEIFLTVGNIRRNSPYIPIIKEKIISGTVYKYDSMSQGSPTSDLPVPNIKEALHQLYIGGDRYNGELSYNGDGKFTIHYHSNYWINFICEGVKNKIEVEQYQLLRQFLYMPYKKNNSINYGKIKLSKPPEVEFNIGDKVAVEIYGYAYSGVISKKENRMYFGEKPVDIYKYDILADNGLKETYSDDFISIEDAEKQGLIMNEFPPISTIERHSAGPTILHPVSLWNTMLSNASNYEHYLNKLDRAKKLENKRNWENNIKNIETFMFAQRTDWFFWEKEYLEYARNITGETVEQQNLRIDLWKAKNIISNEPNDYSKAVEEKQQKAELKAKKQAEFSDKLAEAKINAEKYKYPNDNLKVFYIQGYSNGVERIDINRGIDYLILQRYSGPNHRDLRTRIIKDVTGETFATYGTKRLFEVSTEWLADHTNLYTRKLTQESKSKAQPEIIKEKNIEKPEDEREGMIYVGIEVFNNMLKKGSEHNDGIQEFKDKVVPFTFVFKTIEIEEILKKDPDAKDFVDKASDDKEFKTYRKIETPIIIDENGIVIDGWHRLAQAYYNEEKYIISLVKDETYTAYIDDILIKWFDVHEKHRIIQLEIDNLNLEFDKIKNRRSKQSAKTPTDKKVEVLNKYSEIQRQIEELKEKKEKILGQANLYDLSGGMSNLYDKEGNKYPSQDIQIKFYDQYYEDGYFIGKDKAVLKTFQIAESKSETKADDKLKADEFDKKYPETFTVDLSKALYNQYEEANNTYAIADSEFVSKRFDQAREYIKKARELKEEGIKMTQQVIEYGQDLANLHNNQELKESWDKEAKRNQEKFENFELKLQQLERFIDEKENESEKLVSKTESAPDISYMSDEIIGKIKNQMEKGVLDDVAQYMINHLSGEQKLKPIALYFVVKRLQDSPIGANYTKLYPSDAELKADYDSLVRIKNSEVEHDQGEPELKYKSVPAELKIFMPDHQQKFVNSAIIEFQDIIDRLLNIIRTMPSTFGQKDIDDADKIIYLHYFYSGNDWYVTEKDKGSPDDKKFGILPQSQASGYVILDNDIQMAEWGYISIPVLKKHGRIELDFHFEPQSFKEVINKKYPEPEPEKPNKKYIPDDNISTIDGWVESYVKDRLYWKKRFVFNKNQIDYFNAILELGTNGGIQENDNGYSYVLEVSHESEKEKADNLYEEMIMKDDTLETVKLIKEQEGQPKFQKFEILTDTPDEAKRKQEIYNNPHIYIVQSVKKNNDDSYKYYVNSFLVSGGLLSPKSLESTGSFYIYEDTKEIAVYSPDLYILLKKKYEIYANDTGPHAQPEDVEFAKEFLETIENEIPKEKETIELDKDVIALINYLDSTDNEILRAEMWNYGKYDEEGHFLIASRSRNIEGTGKTLWQIASSNCGGVETVSSGIEKKVYFTGKDILRCIDKELSKNGYTLAEITKEPEELKEPEIKVTVDDNQPLAKGLTQLQITMQVRALIDKNGIDASKYSDDELKLLRLYDGLGGLAKQGYNIGISVKEMDSFNDQFFTPYSVIKLMWGLAYKHGFAPSKDCHILEPSVATGRVLEFAPKECQIDAFEIDKYPYTICKLSFPDINLKLESFESLFFNNKMHIGLPNLKYKYDLVIGNPPYKDYASEYSKMKVKGGTTEKEETLAETFDQYFMMRGVDVLVTGGLLIYVIPNSFLSNGDKYNRFKELLSTKCRLLEAFRLPNGIFPNTQVGTDIIVLQKI